MHREAQGLAPQQLCWAVACPKQQPRQEWQHSAAKQPTTTPCKQLLLPCLWCLCQRFLF